MLDFLNDKPKSEVDEGAKELNEELKKFDNAETQNQTSAPVGAMADESYPIAEALTPVLAFVEDSIESAIATKGLSSAGKQAALDALERTRKDDELTTKLLIEIEKKYGASIVMSPLGKAALVKGAGMSSRILSARQAAKLIGG